jgi:hypothetical protein
MAPAAAVSGLSGPRNRCTCRRHDGQEVLSGVCRDGAPRGRAGRQDACMAAAAAADETDQAVAMQTCLS